MRAIYHIYILTRQRYQRVFAFVWQNLINSRISIYYYSFERAIRVNWGLVSVYVNCVGFGGSHIDSENHLGVHRVLVHIIHIHSR